MTATAIVGVLASFSVFVIFTSAQVPTLDTIASSTGLQYGLVTFIPFIAAVGYFSHRVNKQIARLSKGRYEPLVLLE